VEGEDREGRKGRSVSERAKGSENGKERVVSTLGRESEHFELRVVVARMLEVDLARAQVGTPLRTRAGARYGQVKGFRRVLASVRSNRTEWLQHSGYERCPLDLPWRGERWRRGQVCGGAELPQEGNEDPPRKHCSRLR
jgi:hypothetical protein